MRFLLLSIISIVATSCITTEMNREFLEENVFMTYNATPKECIIAAKSVVKDIGGRTKRRQRRGVVDLLVVSI